MLLPSTIRAAIIPWFLIYHAGLATLAYSSHHSTWSEAIIYVAFAIILVLATLCLMQSKGGKKSKFLSALNLKAYRYISLGILGLPFFIRFYSETSDMPIEIGFAFLWCSLMAFWSIILIYFIFRFSFKLVIRYIITPTTGIAISVVFQLTSIGFLLSNSGSWQVASDLKIPPGFLSLALVILFFYLICMIFNVIRKSTRDSGENPLGRFYDWKDVKKSLVKNSVSNLPEGTLGYIDEAIEYKNEPDKLNRLMEWSYWFSIYTHRLWFIFLGTMVGLLAFIIGLMIIGTNTISKWTGDSVREIHRWDLTNDFGGQLVIAWELVVISSFIAVVATIQFMLVAWLNPIKKKKLVGELEAEIKSALAVREVYLALFGTAGKRRRWWRRHFWGRGVGGEPVGVEEFEAGG